MGSTVKRLAGKVAIITGGASGIGASTARLFSENGAKVAIADIQADLGRSLAGELGNSVSFLHCDVSDEDAVRQLVDAVISKHGKLDIMFNNAGVLDHRRASILDSTSDDLNRVLAVNLYGAFFGAKHAARVMAPRKQGSILFTSSACTSISGIASHPYMVSKYGVLGLAKNLAADLGRFGIRVNCISPSGVFTGMAPAAAGYAAGEGDMDKLVAKIKESGNLKGEMLTAEGVARAAVYLAGDEANFVSGQNLVLDGGFGVSNPSMTMAFSAK